MKTWLRRLLIAAALVGLTLAGLYEYATHVGRGWLRGEAFYEGRPTSYWALRCDEWLERFKDDDSLIQFTWFITFERPDVDGPCRLGPPEDIPFKGGSMGLPRESFWKRVRDSLHTKAELDRERTHEFAPRILWGSPDTIPVLEELARDEKYRLLAELAIRRTNIIRGLIEGRERDASD